MKTIKNTILLAAILTPSLTLPKCDTNKVAKVTSAGTVSFISGFIAAACMATTINKQVPSNQKPLLALGCVLCSSASYFSGKFAYENYKKSPKNELELLKLRLNELCDHLDKFVKEKSKSTKN